MAGDEVDPRYAARFQRGFDSGSDADPTRAADRTPAADETPAADVAPPPAAFGLLVVAGVAAVVAISLVAWLSLDPAFSSRAAPDRVIRAIAEAAPGPLLVGAVLALGVWARSHSARREALAVTFGSAVVMLAALAGAASEFARLASLTAQGPVSSGGIPLPEAALATYQLRVQVAEMLHELLPWLVVAAVLALIAGVASCRDTPSRSKV